MTQLKMQVSTDPDRNPSLLDRQSALRELFPKRRRAGRKDRHRTYDADAHMLIFSDDGTGAHQKSCSQQENPAGTTRRSLTPLASVRSLLRPEYIQSVPIVLLPGK